MSPDTHRATDAPTVKCPGCGTATLFAPTNQWRPFCSERCRNLDLGAWASERYRVNGGNTDDRQDADLSGDAS